MDWFTCRGAWRGSAGGKRARAGAVTEYTPHAASIEHKATPLPHRGAARRLPTIFARAPVIAATGAPAPQRNRASRACPENRSVPQTDQQLQNSRIAVSKI